MAGSSSAVGRRALSGVDRLDLATVVAGAWRIVDHGGLPALTMRALATELQVSVGAVYNHLSGRDAVVAALVEDAMGQVPSPRVDVGDGWRALRAHVLGTQAVLDRHPGLAEAFIAHAPQSQRGAELRADVVRALEAQGLGPREASRAYRSLHWLWLGSRAGLGGRPRRADEVADFEIALDALLDGLRRTSRPRKGSR